MRDFLLNWVLTASLLIGAVVLLRWVFGHRISARLRYALWAVVLVRLLAPGQFLTAPAETPRVLPGIRTVQTLPAGRTFQVEAPGTAPGGETNLSPVQAIPATAGEENTSAPEVQRPLDPLVLLGGGWLAGSIAMAAAFLVSNQSFSSRLRRVRVPLEAADCHLPVYLAKGLPSPCLFGVLNPAVYVTPEAAADPIILRHVLVHETTHYHQGDHLWSMLRCVALAVHWWNPLVWLAAFLNRRDAELACDEGTLWVLGDGERRAYGETLLSLVTAKAWPGDLLRCATTMIGDRRSLRERVRRIAKAPRHWLWATVVTIGLAALACACSYARPAEVEPSAEPSQPPTASPDSSAEPTVYPDWEAELVISLGGLEPCGPEAVTTERHAGNVVDLDLDGDGINELVVSDPAAPQLFIQRDGQIYKADIDALIHEAWPQAKYIEFGYWDAEGRFLPISAQVPIPDSTDSRTVTACRTLFFDGENLRIYKDENGYTNRIANGLEAIPKEVLRQAALFVDTQFQTLADDGYGWDGSGRYNEGNAGSGNVVWDDWRLTGLSGPYYETAGDIRLEIWNVSYETHTTTPERVMLAGGSYVGEDGWCMIGYPGCDYLYFQLGEHEERTFLFSKMENDCFPGSEMFLTDIVRALADLGLLTPMDLDGETLAKIMYPQSARFLNTLAEQAPAEQDEILLFLAGYLAGGSEEGKTYYERFCRELDRVGYRAEELTDKGRTAWNTLKGFVTDLSNSKVVVSSFQGIPE